MQSLEDKERETLEDNKEKKEIRIWMDGAFDMMHFGHMNAFRQGRALGTTLIVGVNSDETITKCKGKPVNSDEERLATVRGCKFVDEVVSGVPYIMNEEYLLWVIDKYKIDFVVHGDDPCIVDGKDVYESAQKLGKYLTIPRTEGISTTDIVGRMLLMSRAHHHHPQLEPVGGDSRPSERRSNFLTTSTTIRLFGAGAKAPAATDTVVYLAGAWDMFHAGHVAILEQARSFGTFVLVGIHSDVVVNAQRGLNLPILNLQERVLSVLGCKWVDDVLIDAPFEITQEMIKTLRIDLVVTGRGTPYTPAPTTPTGTESPLSPSSAMEPHPDPFAVPRQLGILRTVDAPISMSVLEIVNRIDSQREKFSSKFEVKKAQEREYLMNKYGSAL